MSMSSRTLLVTCDEISLKGGNRPWFERLLRKNVWYALGGDPGMRPRRMLGRSAFPLPDSMTEEFVTERLSRVPGVATFAIARPCENDLDAIRALALAEARAAGEGPFRIEAKRSLKTFALTSPQIEKDVGAHVVRETGLKVKLENPRFKVFVLVTEQGAYVHAARHRGPGGLAVGGSGRVVALLSGGIDSPVAAWTMMQRGCRVVFCHFLNQGQDPLAVRTKIEDLVEKLTPWQGRSRLYVVPFEHLQRELIAVVPAPHRMLAYRRVMMRIAARVAEVEGCEAVVTGDSVGQVASQTLPNLATIWSASTLPVLAPLIGRSKRDTVDLSERIGTYPISVEPYPDCCQFMIAEHPATRSTPAELAEFESRIPELAALETKAFEEAEKLDRRFPSGGVAAYPGEADSRRSWGRRKRRQDRRPRTA